MAIHGNFSVVPVYGFFTQNTVVSAAVFSVPNYEPVLLNKILQMVKCIYVIYCHFLTKFIDSYKVLRQA